MKEKVYICAMEQVTGLGIGNDKFYKNLMEGNSYFSRVKFSYFDDYRSRLGGFVKEEDVVFMKEYLKGYGHKSDEKRLREILFSLYCIKKIMTESFYDKAVSGEKIGLIIGSGAGNINALESHFSRAAVEKRVLPLAIIEGMNNNLTGVISEACGLKGMSFVLSTACSSATNAIGIAAKFIQNGMSNAVIAGGVDCGLTDIFFKAWDKLRVMTDEEDELTAMKPFSKGRKGFVLSEGAGFILLASESFAEKYGLKKYAEIIGYASNSDAYHITRPLMESQAECMKMAIEDADVGIEEIDYINAHGTSTEVNDLCETNAIKNVFAKRAYEIPVSSTKSMTGHTLGASGALEIIASVLCMKNGVIHPTINYEKDEECDLNYVPNKAVYGNTNIFLKNSFGFGGNNACIVIKNVIEN